MPHLIRSSDVLTFGSLSLMTVIYFIIYLIISFSIRSDYYNLSLSLFRNQFDVCIACEKVAFLG